MHTNSLTSLNLYYFRQLPNQDKNIFTRSLEGPFSTNQMQELTQYFKGDKDSVFAIEMSKFSELETHIYFPSKNKELLIIDRPSDYQAFVNNKNESNQFDDKT